MTLLKPPICLSHRPLIYLASHATPPLLPSRCFSVCSAGRSSRTIMDVVMEVLRRVPKSPGNVAIRAENKSYSFVQLISAAWNISDMLCNKDFKSVHDTSKDENSGEGIDKRRYLHGARIGIVAKPSAEFVAGVLGTWLSGGVAVPLALNYPEAELLHVMNDSDISVLLSTEDHRELMENVASKCSSQFSLIPAVTSVSSKMSLAEHSSNSVTDLVSKLLVEIENSDIAAGDDPALILYTSGTTGKPKGVVHTHQGIISQVEFMPKFSVRGVWQRWRESYPRDGSKTDDAITLFTGVPTIYTRLLQGYESMDKDLQAASASAARQLRLMMCGSSALPYPVLKQWEQVTGHRLLERYGMTEFVMALSNPLHGNRKGGTVGKPLPRVEVKIIAEDENGTGIAGAGELCVKSPSLFREYWKQPKITKESFVDGGFFKTGDTVTVDEDGYYIILGRTNADIMKVGGYKLSALDIEAVLLEHEAVLECCVLGLPDKYYGEIVCAIIVPQEDAKTKAEQQSKPAISLEELRNWSKDKLAPYKMRDEVAALKIPTKLFVWESLPRNAMGKVNKKELKKVLQE